MSTVNCPNCNKQNIEGSKFCNRCGAALPLSTHITCPNCLTRNPRNLLYCDNCGTRLLATGELSSRREEEKEPEPETRTPRAFSLPTREPGDELDSNSLLDWLRTGEEQPDEGEGTAAAEQEAVLDDWLSELSEVEPAKSEVGGEAGGEEESADFADWFSHIEDEETPAGESGLGDWLADLEAEDEDINTAEPTAIDETVPDWLSELGAVGSEQGNDEDTFADWLSDFNLEDESTAEEVEDETSGLPNTDDLGPDMSDTLIMPPLVQPSELEEVPDWFSVIEDEEETTSDDILQERPEEFFTGEEDTLIAPSPFQESEEALPDWLDEFEEQEETAEEAAAEEAAEFTDWLSDFNAEEGTATLIESTPDLEDQEELPDWLSGSVMDEAEAAPTDSAEESLPDWLSDHVVDMEEAAHTEPADEALPDWLSDSAIQAEEAAPTDSADEALPDWLSDSVVGMEETAHAEPAGEALPDWLGGFESGEEAPTLVGSTGELRDSGELPDWLSEFDSDEEEVDLAAFISDSDEDEAMPGWLSGFSGELKPDSFEDTPDAQKSLDWLDDFEVPGSTEEGVVEAVEGTAAGEDWLDTLFEDEPALEETTFDQFDDDFEAVGTEADSDEGRLPNWLADMPTYDTSTLSPSEEEQEETADIYAGLETSDLSPVDELPDWYSDVSAADEETAVTDAAESKEDDGLPDWLSEFPEDTEGLDAGEDTDWLAALTQEEEWPEVADDEEIVAQLDELEETPVEMTGPSRELKGVPVELVGSDLPGWLQDDMPVSEMPPDDGDEDLFGLGGDQLVQGDLPEWLQQMKPAELEPSQAGMGLEADFSLAETQDEWQNILENMPSAGAAVPSAAALSAAEIPAWLQALRPRDFGQKEEELAEIDEPPETVGPLAGVRGVIPVAAAIAEPTTAAAPIQYTISKDQQQQISLLHRLTHDEPAATKQVSFKKAATFSTGWRTMLGLLLLLVVLAGVLLPGTDIGLPETALPVPQSALDAFNTIEAVSGRSVLVAIEYTPAMAGELDPIALMLMRQLAENGNRVLTISQSAAGTAIAQQLVDQVDNLESRSLGLLTGEAVGLRSLGNCLNSADDCSSFLGSAADTELQGELADVGLILILTSDRNSLINWIEQVETQNVVPFITAVTQPLGPLTIPYLSSDQLEGSLNGIPAASAYEKRLRGQDGSAFQQFAAQTIVMWVVIIMLVVAAVFYGVTGVAKRGTRKDGG